MRNRSTQANKPNQLLPILVIAAGIVLIAAVLLIQAFQAPQANGATTEGQEIPIEDIQRVTLANAKTAFDNKTALFLDVRDTQSFQAGHIPGALNIPLAELESRVSELNPSQWIITYCT